MPKYWEVSQKWVKSKRQREKEKKKKRLNDGNNNGQLRIATPPRVAYAKPHGPKSKLKSIVDLKFILEQRVIISRA